MSDYIIKVENLGKKYRIRHQQNGQRYVAMRDVIAEKLTAPLRWLRERRVASSQLFARSSLLATPGSELLTPDSPLCAPCSALPAQEDFWALRNVSFEVKQGEVVGIIGRNGAGKSTLLKILSRITEPSEGRVRLRGRVASLLEVGTGFHPELTGRENIYLNGALLGMTRAEIRRKFDEIVSFAEVEKFLDTPVKHYSSGMYVRLAFAVAAHLEPEILVVDEVLAVGDVQFQKKCLGKMQEVSRLQGRTVLFVTHNMSTVNQLCSRGALLLEGRLEQVGPTRDVVSAYFAIGDKGAGERTWAPSKAPGNEKMRLRSVRIRGTNGEVTGAVDIRYSFDIEVETEVLHPLPQVRVVFRLSTSSGEAVLTSADSADAQWSEMTRYSGIYLSRCRIPGDFLNEGSYLISVSADVPFIEVFFVEDTALAFQVNQTGGVSGRYPERWPGIVCPRLEWHVNRTEDVACQT